MLREKVMKPLPGGMMLVLFTLVLLLLPVAFAAAVRGSAVGLALGLAVVWVFAIIALNGLFVVNPNEAKVIQLFGSYVGTAKDPGSKGINPFCTKRKEDHGVRN